MSVQQMNIILMMPEGFASIDNHVKYDAQIARVILSPGEEVFQKENVYEKDITCIRSCRYA